ncbi:hypothetical protein C9374_001773 [Naegleria lovaniensis]|uniref:Uncharacterized protein n=1 Tax=Naegleria lovaniensis TaxID=51637 RepID=A0AA88GWX9_NAELO|nr:uncharacterized protein C9374_001773 [Naegleria lovaniensis]KAG2387441.1 hypothetical protein C9374_001773 [Naegleria lovaniensis]
MMSGHSSSSSSSIQHQQELQPIGHHASAAGMEEEILEHSARNEHKPSLVVMGSPSHYSSSSSSTSSNLGNHSNTVANSSNVELSTNNYDNNGMSMMNTHSSLTPNSSTVNAIVSISPTPSPTTASTTTFLLPQKPSSGSSSSSEQSNGSPMANTSTKPSPINHHASSPPLNTNVFINNNLNLKDQVNNSLTTTPVALNQTRTPINQTPSSNSSGSSTATASISQQHATGTSSQTLATTGASEKTTKPSNANISSQPGAHIPIPLPPNASAHMLPYTPSSFKTQMQGIPPLTLCVLMDQLANKIHQHYNPFKQHESKQRQRSASTTSKEQPENNPRAISARNDKHEGTTEGSPSLSSSKQSEVSPPEEHPSELQKQLSPTTVSSSRSMSTWKTTPSLIDLLTEEFQSNPSGYNDLAQATNVLIEFLYGNTDLKERRSAPSYSSSQPSSHVFLTSPPYTSTVYSYPYHQPPSTGYQLIPDASQHHPIHLQPRSVTPTSSSIQPSNKVKATTSSNPPPPFPPPIIVHSSVSNNMEHLSNFKPTSSPIPTSIQNTASPAYSPSKGLSEEKTSNPSTPVRIRCAPPSATTSVGTSEPLSSGLFLRKDESMFEPSTEETVKKRRGIKKVNEMDTATDEQDSRFSCYICEKSVVDKNTKYTLTSNNYSSFAEVFPHVKIPMFGESKRICANCYHKKYRASRKKKEQIVEEKTTAALTSIPNSNLLAPALSVDLHSETPERFTCCICSKSSTSPSFVDNNAITAQNYHSYLSTFPQQLPQQLPQDRLLPVCESCKLVHENAKKRKQPPSSSSFEQNEASKKLKQ